MNEYQDFFDKADELRGSGGSIFPAGVYRGKIAGTSMAEDHPTMEEGTPEGWDDQDDSLIRLRFSLQDNEADQWMFVDLTLQAHEHDFKDMPEQGSNDFYAISSAIVKLGDLAGQLGYEVDARAWQEDLLEFASLLVNGKYTGKKVTFETFQKTITSKRGKNAGKTKVVVNVTPRGFLVAEED
jgi:hypothetical protein